MTIIEDADFVKGKEPRLRDFRTKNGREFVGKGTACPKRKGKQNPTWLANELIYAEFANANSLRIPETAIFRNEKHLYFGSEKLPGRVPLQTQSPITQLFDRNREQLTRAALLDLALLNSDRTAGNMLIDNDGLLWFYDHDKSLCGDGLPAAGHAGQAGDLGRLQPSQITPAFTNFLGDYLFLRLPEAFNLVFSKQKWEIIQAEFSQLRLNADLLAQARKAIPDPSWLSNELCAMLEQFLVAWWARLRAYFDGQKDATNLLAVLRQRQNRRNE